MTSSLRKLFEPGRIGTLEVKNRIVMAPMSAPCDAEGFIEDRLIDYYAERARGGVGLIITSSSAALRMGRAPRRPGSWDDKFIPGLARVADAVHKYDCKVAMQVLYHGKLMLQWLNQVPRPWEIRAVAPSSIPWVKVGLAPEEATREDIEFIIDQWAEAARRIRDAGFDAVEIHGGHGYAICQWLSPRDNKRTDEYGGSLENRARFGCEVISRVRAKVGHDFPVIFRFSGSDFMPGGITLEQSVLQAPLFVKAGADALHMSASAEETTQWQFLTYLFPDGAIVPLAGAIRKAVKVPVITVGKIHDPFFAEKVLEEGKADFIAMGRALLADPHWANKVREGRLEDIRPCIYCNNCINPRAWPSKIQKLGRSCTVNPAVIREKEFEIQPAASPKNIWVIGGGVAGMEAARVLAERGHRVSLYEESNKLGGKLDIAAQQPQKDGYARFIDYEIRELAKAKVPVTLNTRVTPEMVDKAKPDIVIVATGSSPLGLNIPGASNKNVVQANDVITGKAKVGNSVVVVGGRLLGMEIALQLTEQGKQVTLVEQYLLGGPTEHHTPPDRNTYHELRNRLFKARVPILENSPATEIREDGVYVAFHKELVFLESDSVVLAVGVKAENELYDKLQKAGHCSFMVGDCVEPRDAAQAVREGAELGRQL